MLMSMKMLLNSPKCVFSWSWGLIQTPLGDLEHFSSATHDRRPGLLTFRICPLFLNHSVYVYYEFVHEVHNKEKLKNKRTEKRNKNTK